MRPAARPAEIGTHGFVPKMDGETLGVGKKNIVEAVPVEINETKSGILASGIHERHALGQGVIGFDPLLGCGIPALDFVGAFAADQFFLNAIVVKIVKQGARRYDVGNGLGGDG